MAGVPRDIELAGARTQWPACLVTSDLGATARMPRGIALLQAPTSRVCDCSEVSSSACKKTGIDERTGEVESWGDGERVAHVRMLHRGWKQVYYFVFPASFIWFPVLSLVTCLFLLSCPFFLPHWFIFSVRCSSFPIALSRLPRYFRCSVFLFISSLHSHFLSVLFEAHDDFVFVPLFFSSHALGAFVFDFFCV